MDYTITHGTVKWNFYKSVEALPLYRRLVEDYPGSPQARKAAERIRAIEKSKAKSRR